MLDLSAWARQLYDTGVVNALNEANLITNDMVAYKFGSGTSYKDFKVGSRTVKNGQSSSGFLPVGSNSDTAVVTTVDDELYVHEYIPYTYINQNGGEVPANIAGQMGRDLAERRMKSILSFITQTAITAGNVTIYDNEDTTGQAVFDAFMTGTAQLTRNKVPTRGRICFMEPIQFYTLRKWAQAAVSRDYKDENQPTNSMIGIEGFMLAQTLILPATAIFNTDESSNTNIAPKYRYNFATGTSGAGYYFSIWHPDAIRLFEIEAPNGALSDSPETQSVLAVARCQFGTGALDPAKCWTGKGDNS